MPAQTEPEALGAYEGEFNGPWAERVFRVLANASSAPDIECFCGLWEGHMRGRPTARFRVSENHIYWLYAAPLTAVAKWLSTQSGESPPDAPDMMWPKDRQWCLVTPFNHFSTFVAGPLDLIRSLLRLVSEVDVRPVSLDDRLTYHPTRRQE